MHYHLRMHILHDCIKSLLNTNFLTYFELKIIFYKVLGHNMFLNYFEIIFSLVNQFKCHKGQFESIQCKHKGLGNF